MGLREQKGVQGAERVQGVTGVVTGNGALGAELVAGHPDTALQRCTPEACVMF